MTVRFLGCLLIGVCFWPQLVHAQALPRLDFSKIAEFHEWGFVHEIGNRNRESDGMHVTLRGLDPYLIRKPLNFPPNVPLLVRMRVKSESGGMAQIFFGVGGVIREELSARIPLAAGNTWQNVHAIVPPLGPNTLLRIDPPGNAGEFAIASMEFEPRLEVTMPEFPRPGSPTIDGNIRELTAGNLTLRHRTDAFNSFDLRWKGSPLATGLDRPLIGYRAGLNARWVDLAASGRVAVDPIANGLQITVIAADVDGATWTLQQKWIAHPDDRISVDSSLTVNQRRDLIFAPMVMLLPGNGSFGAKKSQALFAGLEYLDDEPSSSEADLVGPAAIRRVPSPEKITFPLMTIAIENRWLAMTWDISPETAAYFDSPDRIFGSGSHAMGLLAPGAHPERRADGEIFPYLPLAMQPNQPHKVNAIVFAGDGATIVPSVQRYLQLKGVPPFPPLPSREDYVERTIEGWLDTSLREGNQFRHATGVPGFAAQPAADASWMLDWLSVQAKSKRDSERAARFARDSLLGIPPQNWPYAKIGHLNYPLTGFLNGQALESTQSANGRANGLINRFDPQGTVLYSPPGDGKLDLSRTNPDRQASGFAGEIVANALEAAILSGQPETIQRAVVALSNLERFQNGVPRGAQTWEVPLHTPDILGSAHLVTAYVRGYELTGEARFLERAKYWAWTGVPFVYLRQPTPGQVGAYATIAVLGATQWQAPIWLGLPVQWCGLAYADSLWKLAAHDPNPIWKTLAEGITRSGIQQNYPEKHPSRGLLPDSFNLITQSRNVADINPGTLQPLAIRLYDQAAPGVMQRLPQAKLWVIAPAAVAVTADTADRVDLLLHGWSKRPYQTVIHGLRRPPTVKINDQAVGLNDAVVFVPGSGSLILTVSGTAKVQIIP
ncbi:hypothetical protein : Uncharacterized protein OS=Chthonomonas calidirosea (strain DSM 23976 / ICMP 18418 / T49) GN=CCALI_02122 PE=4 SV=1 [Tuwongella immobilis]|uniref:Uncharacterized protein n=2 Tax=Tuwongella immobilis TaxID=692036 RepID=A0A6C2YP17_9BACT|nr:hypothetical protein : Uncharacterized protein OS=Chthonomonas calidirosea (strain DSM 23976 / ICMP 18418 / T49) GN=CCALI_02122 PE=4 SV=1 [Tuwongella immobilis]VTS02707.1 hypothetical protein : Uncharacterized protein OS=Chthonomonas calidirosea (strain DSM 23976 / ICMP 18418 / T49) GN=CCALI_02122 PE=4 SV=1 [Tuwongella immobilis]